MSAICDGCGQTAPNCPPTCPRRKTRHALIHTPRRRLRVVLAGWIELLTALPYRPALINPRPLLDAIPAPDAARPQPQPDTRTEDQASRHAAGSRSNLRPVGALLAASDISPRTLPPGFNPRRGQRLMERVEAARTDRAEALTQPIPLDEIALLSHVGCEELLAEIHQDNHSDDDPADDHPDDDDPVTPDAGPDTQPHAPILAATPRWRVRFVGPRPGPGRPGRVVITPYAEEVRR